MFLILNEELFFTEKLVTVETLFSAERLIKQEVDDNIEGNSGAYHLFLLLHIEVKINNYHHDLFLSLFMK